MNNAPRTTRTGFVIENAWWYTDIHGEIIGIVRGHSDAGEVKYYIGIGGGENEAADEILVAEEGSRFYPEAMKEETA